MSNKSDDVRKKFDAVASVYSKMATFAFTLWVVVSVPRAWHFTVDYVQHLISLIP